jgi:hypothetical protein
LALGLLLMPALNLGRRSAEFDIAMLTPQVRSINTNLTSSDFDAYVNLALINKLIDFEGVTYGRQLLGALLFWVPRSFWTDKPFGSGWYMAETLGLPFRNISAPLPAEALINFGLFGLPFVAMLFGALIYRTDHHYFLGQNGRPPQRFQIIDCIYPFWLGLVVFITRGDLLNGFAYFSGVTFAAFLALLPFSEPYQGDALTRKSTQ